MNALNKIVVNPYFQQLVNTNAVSRLFGWIARCHIPRPILGKIIFNFIRSYKINMDDYEINLEKIKSFNEFFGRKLKPGIRNMAPGIISPVDGFIANYGLTQQGQILQVKGSKYSIEQLLQKEYDIEDSSFLTIYLSPADYHGVHAPFDMFIEEMNYIPGKLFSTSRSSLLKFKNIYCRNERVVIKGSGNGMHFYLVLVGAMLVGKIKLTFCQIETNKKGKANSFYYKEPLYFGKGDELGHFEMGSTVVLIADNAVFNTVAKKELDKITFGETLCQ